MSAKIEIGQKIYLKPVGNMIRSYKGKPKEEWFEEGEIKKIGRKYFEVLLDKFKWSNSSNFNIKFNIKDLTQATEYSEEWEIRFSKQEILDEHEVEDLTWKIKEQFNYGRNKLSLNKLRRIINIMNESEE